MTIEINILLLGLLILLAMLGGFAITNFLDLSGRARLESHIAAQRTTLRKAHSRLLQIHREQQNQGAILKEIEDVVAAVLEEETR